MEKNKLNLLKLKVKAKSLAEESRIIRRLENNPCDKYNSLYFHRTINVRNESRATHLAVAFLTGKKYKSIEKICKDERKLFYTIVPRVEAMVKKYGTSQFVVANVRPWIGQ